MHFSTILLLFLIILLQPIKTNAKVSSIKIKFLGVGMAEHTTYCSCQYCTHYQSHSLSGSETKSTVFNEQ